VGLCHDGRVTHIFTNYSRSDGPDVEKPAKRRDGKGNSSPADKSARDRPQATERIPAPRAGNQVSFTWPTGTQSVFERMPALRALRTIGEGGMVVLAIFVVVVLAWGISALLSPIVL